MHILDSRLIGGGSAVDGGAVGDRRLRGRLPPERGAPEQHVFRQWRRGLHVGGQAGLFATGLLVRGNSARYGGGIAVDTTGPVNISQSAVLDNSAVLQGGLASGASARTGLTDR